MGLRTSRSIMDCPVGWNPHPDLEKGWAGEEQYEFSCQEFSIHYVPDRLDQPRPGAAAFPPFGAVLLIENVALLFPFL